MMKLIINFTINKINMTEIVPRVFIGNAENARNLNWLQKHKISHIVNATVEVPNYYISRFSYHNMNMIDLPIQSLSPKIQKAYTYINNALENPYNRVLIHCNAGVSRSSSTLIYFLMKKYNLSFLQAYQYVKNVYPKANPNSGFLEELNAI